ncbi:hypothetical protein EG346_17120 [Chryseobacterium carnipullorum]|uniref:Uncharacterized protein n=1 Tax=Chryseobacterium carnipullorum TaxID=1124835 RepID=A0A376DUC1_CHRCU|nr:hypothetical protein [Chryseobacterium carnipullorum]AZA49795.1 hypothetical protein EG346_17120 [Chryseobacterium carnipullorum]AZA64686.1 hypothetical protein EG345_08145 [Chryseobacterium carnipullorum]STC95761.1 Uncharacterised protein [Chryseobacterium carnipullorum]
MNDKEISIELLKLYPQYEGEYTFLQFINLFQQLRQFIPNKKRMATKITKLRLKDFDSVKDDSSGEFVFLEFNTIKMH